MVLGEALRRPRLAAAAACFLVGAAVLLGGLWAGRATEPAPATAFDLAPLDVAPMAPPLEAPSAPPAELVVYITGAVPRPDVYRLAPGARVKDVVAAAGGLAPDAAAEQVNLAEPLGDAAHVHIPTIADLAAPPPPAGLPAALAPAGAAQGLLDLNVAAEADLEELPGVGKVIAARIVARRAEVGPYIAVEDLRQVTGVGEKLYAQIAPLVTVTP